MPSADRNNSAVRKSNQTICLAIILLAVHTAFFALPAWSRIELLNASYDATRELWKEINASFCEKYERKTGVDLDIAQSHGGSSSQARAIIEGMDVDVASLALWTDINALVKRKLVAADWENRLPNHSCPYFSTIVFVVRRGNPHHIVDWPDIVRPDVKVITPNPKTSGNGKLSFLAAWGSVVRRGGTPAEAQDFVKKLYANVPVLDSGARGASATFAQKHIGDVHLAWESEAYLELKDSNGSLEIVHPPQSIKAEPPVTWIDANVKRKGPQVLAAIKAYLLFLYSHEGQDIVARHYYRPIDPAIQRKYTRVFQPIELFSVNDISGGWNDANKRFFGDDGIFDKIYERRK
jgi:sulfate/thiosulfate-binding protein